MELTENQKRICEQVLNAFETGSAEGNYADISIFHDGPGRIRQLTYGRSQTTEYGNLHELLEMYAQAGGVYSAQIAPYVDQIGHRALVDNEDFKRLLRQAGRNDLVMRTTQDRFFEKRYWQPAVAWATANGFTTALGMLVIYDSEIHSGGVPSWLRKRFTEMSPAKGGDERAWLRAYVAVRQSWLANHANPDLHGTVYRTHCLLDQIALANWDLSRTPISANGVMVR